MEVSTFLCPDHFNMAHPLKRIQLLTCRNVSASYSIGNFWFVQNSIWFPCTSFSLYPACRHHTLDRENHGRRKENTLDSNTSTGGRTPGLKDDNRIFRLLRERTKSRILGYKYIQAQPQMVSRYEAVAQSVDHIVEDMIPGELWSLVVSSSGKLLGIWSFKNLKQHKINKEKEK